MTGLAVVEGGVRIDIGEACLDTEADIALDEAWRLLNDEERTRAESFVFARDRDRFVRAHGYLRRTLGVFLGIAPGEVPIAVDAGGKPYVEGGGAHFNLSHSGSRMVVAVTSSGDVGIDLELMDRSESFQDQLDGLSSMCLNAEEQDALSGLPQEQRVRRFLSFWTAKEARMKLTGEGMALEPRAIALRLSSGVPVGYRRPRSLRADLRFIALSNPDAICCLAVRRDGDQAFAHQPRT